MANFPLKLNMNNMISSLDGNNSVTKGSRFVAQINPTGSLFRQLDYWSTINENLIYACDSAEFPGRAFNVTELRIYGPRQLTPSNTLYGDGISLSFICRAETKERQFFDDWMELINPTSSYHFKYPEEYYAEIDIVQYAEYGEGSTTPTVPNDPTVKYNPKPIYAWKLYKAWPTLVAPQAVTWADSDILRVQVTFAYKKWKRTLGDTNNIASKLYGR